MALPIKKIVTAAVWGWAFKWASELVVAMAHGAWAGAQLGKGRTVDEMQPSFSKRWITWNKFVPPATGIVGLALGLLGLLPGTGDR